jgi:hypothetical protein
VLTAIKIHPSTKLWCHSRYALIAGAEQLYEVTTRRLKNFPMISA